MSDELNPTTAIDNSTQQPPAPKPAPIEDVPTLTQKQVDALMGNTRKEASATALLAMAKKLGFETVEEMETAAKEAQETKKKNQTELEQEKEARLKAEKERDEAKQLASTEAAKRRADYVDGRMTTIANAAKAVDAAEVAEWLRSKKADEIDALYGEDGKLNEAKARELVEEIKKSKPHWFQAARGVGSPSVSGGRAQEPNADMNKNALNKLRSTIRNS